METKLIEKIKSNPGISLSKVMHEEKTFFLYEIKKSDQRNQEINNSLKFKEEYGKMEAFKSEVLLNYDSYEDSQDRLKLFLDCDGLVSLNQARRFEIINLKDALLYSVDILNGLRELHEQGIVHRFLSPEFIFVSGKHAMLSGHLIGRLVSIDKQLVSSDSFGRVRYASPEQLSSSNKTIDLRSDLYSFGVVLYEMIIGSHPFGQGDPLEIMHSHMASSPTPPKEINHDIPEPLSDLVMRLLKKNPEERYHSAEGVIFDINQVLKIIDSGSKEGFTLGAKDRPKGLALSQKIYGRDKEKAVLDKSYQEALNGNKQIVFLRGYSGIGKTALVNFFREGIDSSDCIYAGGKFDQYRRDVPYSAFRNAFSKIFQEILSSSDKDIKFWQGEIKKKMGSNTKYIKDVIPELSLLIGEEDETDEATDTGYMETKNRLSLAFERLIDIIAKHKTLILFIDDLQWVDLASINLIEELVDKDFNSAFQFIGAYRSNEVKNDHPLILALEKDNRIDDVITVDVDDLKVEDIKDLLSDSFSNPNFDIYSLAEILSQKTGGNPFFIKEHLKYLYKEKALFIDESGRWNFDQNKLLKERLSENIIELLSNKIKDLPEDMLYILKIGSCFNEFFTLDLLEKITKINQQDIFSSLEYVKKDGYIYFTDGGYKFVHDSIKQAVYELLSKNERQKYHLQIGKILMELLSQNTSNITELEVVDHFNAGADLADQDLLAKIVPMNLKAAVRAKKSLAFDSASIFLVAGIKQLEKAPGLKEEFLLEFKIELAEVEFLLGNFESSEKKFGEILLLAKSKLEKARIQQIMLNLYQYTSRYEDAVKVGVDCLNNLGLKIPATPGKASMLIPLLKIQYITRSISVDDILRLSSMTDKSKKRILQVMSQLVTPAYFTNRNLVYVLMLENVMISLKYGNSPESEVGYMIYALILGVGFGKIDRAVEIGKLSLEMNKRSGNMEDRAYLNLLYGGFINHWKYPLDSSIDYLIDGYVAGIETGRYTHAGYCAGLHPATLAFKGESLMKTIETCDKYSENLEKIKHDDMIFAVNVGRSIAMNLLGNNKHGFKRNDFNEDKEVLKAKKEDKALILCIYYTYKIPETFFMERYEEAIEMGEYIQNNKDLIFGRYHTAVHLFYFSMSILGLMRKIDVGHKKYFKIVKKNQKQMKKFALNCSENFQHKYALVQAEIFSLKGQNEMAEKMYDQAIQSAKKNNFTQELAIAFEYAGKHFLRREKSFIAEAYIKKAKNYFSLWGSELKASDLQNKYLEFFEKEKAGERVENDSFDQKDEAEVLDLSYADIGTLAKATSAISEENNFDSLASKLLGLAIENVGASKGVFIEVTSNGYKLRTKEIDGKSDLKVDNCGRENINNYIAEKVFNFVKRTGEALVLDDASADDIYKNDTYVKNNKTKSLLCMSITRKKKVLGWLYLENNVSVGEFSTDRLKFLKLLLRQAAISLENTMLYDNLKAKNENLKELLKMKSNFLRIVHHQLNTPLSIIRMGAGGIKEGVMDAEAGLKIINGGTEKMNSVINGMWQAYEIEGEETSLDLKQFDVKKLIRSIVREKKDLNEYQSKSLEIKVINNVKDSLIFSDENKVRFAFSTLLENSLFYTREGEIKIYIDESNQNVFDCTNCLKVTVVDSGEGIPEKDQKNIFKKFIRGSNAALIHPDGSGLNLYIAKKVIKTAGGELRFEKSEPKKETVFSMVLPREKSQTKDE